MLLRIYAPIMSSSVFANAKGDCPKTEMCVCVCEIPQTSEP